MQQEVLSALTCSVRTKIAGVKGASGRMNQNLVRPKEVVPLWIKLNCGSVCLWLENSFQGNELHQQHAIKPISVKYREMQHTKVMTTGCKCVINATWNQNCFHEPWLGLCQIHVLNQAMHVCYAVTALWTSSLQNIHRHRHLSTSCFHLHPCVSPEICFVFQLSWQTGNFQLNFPAGRVVLYFILLPSLFFLSSFTPSPLRVPLLAALVLTSSAPCLLEVFPTAP